MNTQFRGLKIIGSLLKIIGVLAFFLAVCSLIVAPLALSNADGIFKEMGFVGVQPGIGLLVGLLTGVLLFIFCIAGGMLLFALGECFNVLLTIETNTRSMMNLLEKEAGTDEGVIH